MPQLKTGRQFVLSYSPLKDAFSSGADRQMYYRITQFRLSANSAADILPFACVGYFDPAGQGPPDGSTFGAGFTVEDIFAGRTDWSPEEVEEFRSWSSSDRVAQWLASEFLDINQAIQNSPVWQSDLVLGD